jgi:hypothetical protein
VTVDARGTILRPLADRALTLAHQIPNATHHVQVFRIVGGQYSVVILGSGINLSAVGRGRVVGQGITDGLFSTDGSPFRTVQPLLLYTDTFGQQQTTAGPTQP